MKKFAPLFIACLSFGMFSCHNETVVCKAPAVQLFAVGFTAADFSQGAILYRYKKDSVFDSLIDSFSIGYAISISDTTPLSQVFSNDYDFRLTLKATGSNFDITGINMGGTKTQTIQRGIIFNDKAYSCFLQVTTYDINGSHFTQPTNKRVFFTDSVFVHK
jgi:hypothetical protein